MKFEVFVNNYMIGAIVKSTPTDKIIERETLGRNKIRLVYELSSDRERERVERILAKKLKPLA